ncbi:hypothetical protein DL766_006765 [Monosporascus sp. MC13-8B]|uniref:Rhodopsin domain-containing protein n=1 Tax=Monosporascus cannonballus TaxID=155416 RepID=A0ABY0HD01_9PEZI|nr:hypothetical protein DL762_002604 [Monosporascus cannonballus]RYP01564.1 hypothetical protein DL763_000095 [Monosporascus cannonballus]RYP26312.1 hypothetical protein DL766_006765 [Monosporascus sp. MC13-8B]
MDANGTAASADPGLVYLPVLPYAKDQFVASIAVAILALLIVGVRVVGRRLGPGLGWDDGLIIFSTPLAISLLAAQGLTLDRGSGYDQNEHPEVYLNISYILKVIFAIQYVYTVSLAATKASVLCFYLRVFATTNMARSSKWMLGFCVAWVLTFILAPLFICRPVSAQWNDISTCGDLFALIQACNITNIASDLAIMWLPIPSIWPLQARKTDRIGIMACFALGLGCVVCCVVRLIYMSAANATGNLTAALPTTLFLVILEPNIAIICVSIPMLRPLYTTYRKRKGGSRLREGSHKRSTAGSGGLSGPSSQRSRGVMAVITSHSHITGWEMEDYRPDMVARRDTTVTAAADDSGSEENLTHSEPATKRDEGAIRVETEWTMSRS